MELIKTRSLFRRIRTRFQNCLFIAVGVAVVVDDGDVGVAVVVDDGDVGVAVVAGDDVDDCSDVLSKNSF